MGRFQVTRSVACSEAEVSLRKQQQQRQIIVSTDTQSKVSTDKEGSTRIGISLLVEFGMQSESL